MKKKITFEVNLDKDNLPKHITMKADDSMDIESIKALMISAWDSSKKETLRIDLWTKDMTVIDMFITYHQTMLGMANSLEKSTGNKKLADALRDYCEFFAEDTEILNKKI
jgi:gliding motility-associated protein GldC